jgi:hypothetical protein
VPDLLQSLRKASPGDASRRAELLQSGTDPASLWDALFLGGAELVMLHTRIIALHAVTSMNALHHATRNAAEDQTRLLMLLQRRPTCPVPRRRGSAPARARRLQPVASHVSEPAEILAEVGPHTPRATGKALAFLDQAGNLPRLRAAARAWSWPRATARTTTSSRRRPSRTSSGCHRAGATSTWRQPRAVSRRPERANPLAARIHAALARRVPG